MKIAAVLHKVGWAKPELFLRRLEETLRLGADVVMGPDYALDYDLRRPNTVDEKSRIYERIRMMSQRSKTLILPGTMSSPIEVEMVHVAPVFCGGNLIAELHKERDNGESGLAERAGLVFRRGDSRGNRVAFRDKQLAVEICGDHGHQDVRGCDVELIMAYDKLAGFYISAGNDGFARKAVVCDGYRPFASAFDYDPARTKSPKLITITGDDIKLNSGKVRIFGV